MAFQSAAGAALLRTTRQDGGATLEAMPFGPRPKVNYSVQTVTGDMPGAGTSANVFITLHGSQGDSRRVQLNNNGEKNFLRGRTDTFVVRELDLGEIESITVSHDDHSSFSERFDPAWFLERVIVRGRNCEWNFPCRRWLAKDKEDGKTKRTLYSRTPDASISYKVTVYTGDRPDGGTIGRVSIRLEGQKGTSDGFVQLKNPSIHDTFERSMKDMFVIKARDVGPLVGITVRHNAPPGEGGWHLAGMVVRNLKSNEEYPFPCGEMLGENDSKELKFRLGAQIPVGVSPAAKALDEKERKHALLPPRRNLSLDADHDPYKGLFRDAPSQYEIVVYTSHMKDAGTDANVFLRIFGTDRNTGSLRLAAHAPITNRLFNRGNVDKFIVGVQDVGTPIRIAVWTDGRNASDLGSAWHCEKITIKKLIQGRHSEVWEFPCHAWFDVGAGNTLKRELIPQATFTGVRRPASASLAGRRPATAATSVGGGDRTVPYEGGRGGVVRPASARAAAPVTVLYEEATSRHEGHVPYVPQVRATYRVIVHTGDRPHAGTDCEVMLRLHGDLRSSGSHRLSSCAIKAVTLFKRGAADEFLVQDWDVGKVRKVSIWHDGKGSDPHWFLQKVVVERLSEGNVPIATYTFDCAEWLSPTEGQKKMRAELSTQKDSSKSLRMSQRPPTRPFMQGL